MTAYSIDSQMPLFIRKADVDKTFMICSFIAYYAWSRDSLS